MSSIPDFDALLRPCRWPARTGMRPQEDRRCQVLACSGLPEECPAVSGVRRILAAIYPQFCRYRTAPGGIDRKGCPLRVATSLRDSIH